MFEREPVTPLPVRPSEAERERVIERLKRDVSAGRLSTDTFAARVSAVLAARDHAQLREARFDLRRAGPWTWVARVVRRVSECSYELRAAWREPRAPRLTLPSGERELVLGRAAESDCLVADDTVSRTHAAIRRTPEGWVVRDLGSSNGTRVNGWRVTEETLVLPGDRLSLGDARFRLTAPARRTPPPR